VLYEMLTGRRAFDGEDVSDTLANVLKMQPDWDALPPDLSPAIRALLEGCLTKDRGLRVADASTALFVIDRNTALAATPGAPRLTTAAPPPVWRRAAAMAGVALAGAVVVSTGAWLVTRRSPPPVTRFVVPPPENVRFETGGRPGTSAMISPDGRTLAFTAEDTAGRNLIWVQPLDSLMAQPLAGTDGAEFPFWSPDSRFIGYFAQNKLLKIAVGGGR